MLITAPTILPNSSSISIERFLKINNNKVDDNSRIIRKLVKFKKLNFARIISLRPLRNRLAYLQS